MPRANRAERKSSLRGWFRQRKCYANTGQHYPLAEKRRDHWDI